MLPGMRTPVASRGSAQFNLRLPDELRDRIQTEAARNGRSMNTEIVARLMESLEEGAGGRIKDLEAKLDRILALLEGR